MTGPNPGSDEALEKGCICPVMDNNHGRFAPWTGNWWLLEGCPLHAPTEPSPSQSAQELASPRPDYTPDK
jgi:hypothetical protein